MLKTVVRMKNDLIMVFDERAERRYFWEDIAIFIGKRRGLISSRGGPE